MKKTRRSETLNLKPLVTYAELSAESIDHEKRTVDLLFYSGEPVLRFSWMDDEPYELEFELSEKAIRWGRLRNGAPLLNSHQKYAGVSAILGVVEKAWLDNGGRATVRFSRRDDVEPYWQDVQDGVIRNVSMGVSIHAMEEVTKKGASIKRMRATDWEPSELSLVPVGADPGARTLSLAEERESAPCKITYRAEAAAEAQMEETMTVKVRLLRDVEELGKIGDIVEIEREEFDLDSMTVELKPATKAASEPSAPATTTDPAAEKITAEMRIEKDKARRAEIKKIAAYYDLDDIWAEAQHQAGIEIEQVLTRAEEERKKRAPKPAGSNITGFGNDYEGKQFKLEAMAEGLVSRATRKAPSEKARPYYGFSFAELALAALELEGKGRGLDARADRTAIFSTNLALHTTSDFPLLLANALNKMLLPEYENRTPTYRMLASQRNFRDFRAHKFDRSGDFPAPLEVGEHGEYQYGTMGENQEQVTLLKYGRIMGISYETLVNDDLSAFANLATKAARRTVDFENATFYSVCIAPNSGTGPALSDAVVVYHANHSNVLSGSALSLAHLDEARELMLGQTSIDGIKINVQPRYLLVPPASAGLAERLVAPQSMLIGQGASAAPVSNNNNWAGRLTPVTDANLTGSRFYLLADPAELEQYVYGYLEGANGPRTEVRNGFTTDGIEFKLALEFACGAIEYRAGVTGAGS